MDVCGWVFLLSLVIKGGMVPLMSSDLKYDTEEAAQKAGNEMIAEYTYMGVPIFGEDSTMIAMAAPIPANLCPFYSEDKYDPDKKGPGDTLEDKYSPVVNGFFL